MKKQMTKVTCSNPIRAMEVKNTEKVKSVAVYANLDGQESETLNTQNENKTPWWEITSSIGNTLSEVLGAVFPFFNKQNVNGSTQIVKNNSNDMFKYLVFGVLAIIVILLVFRFMKK